MVDGVRLANGRVFAQHYAGMADGMRTDSDGNLWSSAGWGGAGSDGVHCFTPLGYLIGTDLPEPCSNLCFGGAKRMLFHDRRPVDLRSLIAWRRWARKHREKV